jgi:23S rRNA (guanosine2251-2'-O)-methyltransferase
MPIIFGINPLLEALHAKEPLEKIYLLAGPRRPALDKIFRIARSQKIIMVQADRKKLDHLSGGKNHQGIVALLPAISYIGLQNLLEKIQKSGRDPNLFLADRLTDPQNFGALIRSAEVLGVDGIIFCLRDSTPVTDQVVKASAGAVFHLDICKVTNLVRAVEYLQQCGVWIYASSSHAQKSLGEMDFKRPLAIIVGSEGKGVRPLLVKKSDEIFRIPQRGKTESLNVSVAAGIIMSEILKQRTAPSRK